MTHPGPLHAIAAVLAAALATTSCTGYLVGYGIDVATPRSLAPVQPDSIPITPGDKIILVFRRGARVSGRFLGMGQLADSAYLTAFDESRERLAAQSVWIPRLAESVSVELLTNEALVAEFRDVRHDTVVVVPLDDPTDRTIRAADIRTIRGEDGGVVDGHTLDSLVSERAIPAHTSVLLRSANEVASYEFNSIDRVLKRRTTGRWVGVVTEAALEVVVLVVALSSMGNIAF